LRIGIAGHKNKCAAMKAAHTLNGKNNDEHKNLCISLDYLSALRKEQGSVFFVEKETPQRVSHGQRPNGTVSPQFLQAAASVSLSTITIYTYHIP